MSPKNINKIFLIGLSLLVIPLAVFAAPACSDVTAASTQLCNGLGGTNTFPQLLTKVFVFVGTVIGMLAVTMIVYSGFRMLIARGEPDALKTAKAGFSYAIIGVVISVMSFGIVLAFQKFIGVGPNGNIVDGQINNPLKDSTTQGFISTIVTNFLGLIGILASVMIIYNAYLYITAAGNEQQTAKAKTGLLWSVVGFLTAFMAYVLITALKNIFT